ncbi:MAG: hypothetical protein AAFX87_14500 [Bacteroidota bacterium]
MSNMIKLQRYLFILMATSLTLSCSKPVDIDGFDETVWKNDKMGCASERVELLNSLMNEREKIKGLNTSEIVKVLGKPDIHDLSKRNQKYFVYNVTPGPKCERYTEGASSTTLKVRFNAVGLAYEVLVDKPIASQSAR